MRPITLTKENWQYAEHVNSLIDSINERVLSLADYSDPSACVELVLERVSRGDDIQSASFWNRVIKATKYIFSIPPIGGRSMLGFGPQGRMGPYTSLDSVEVVPGFPIAEIIDLLTDNYISVVNDDGLDLMCLYGAGLTFYIWDDDSWPGGFIPGGTLRLRTYSEEPLPSLSGLFGVTNQMLADAWVQIGGVKLDQLGETIYVMYDDDGNAGLRYYKNNLVIGRYDGGVRLPVNVWETHGGPAGVSQSSLVVFPDYEYGGSYRDNWPAPWRTLDPVRG